jgi:nucleotide-binding universal stress UspA family protein
MYRKVLVPLDGSADAEGVLPTVRGLISPESEVILFQVISPGRSRAFGEYTVRREAIRYLRQVVSKLGEPPGQWRCESAISASVADGIADFARSEEVALIAMYTRGRKGLAKLMKGSIAEKVQKKAATEVQIFKPSELVAVA